MCWRGYEWSCLPINLGARWYHMAYFYEFSYGKLPLEQFVFLCLVLFASSLVISYHIFSSVQVALGPGCLVSNLPWILSSLDVSRLGCKFGILSWALSYGEVALGASFLWWIFFLVISYSILSYVFSFLKFPWIQVAMGAAYLWSEFFGDIILS